jgi:nucleoside phosphorylase
MSTATQIPSREDFRIAIICPLILEAKVTKPLLQPIYDPISHPELEQSANDPNSYKLGKIGPYYAILASMPTAGKAAASSVASNIRSSYPKIELAFLVGVCGGIPRIKQPHVTAGRTDIYLGDVIVSTGVVQYDLGKRLSDSRFDRKDTLDANLGRPNHQIRSFIAKVEASDDDLRRRQSEYLAVLQNALKISYPGDQRDVLLSQNYSHKKTGCQCSQSPPTDNTVIDRQRELGILPWIHFGNLASGDTVMMTAKGRDGIAKKEQVIGFEMEGAGVWDNLPCILVKGVSDYADSHKSKDWQLFAAMNAAACMRALLDERPIPPSQRVMERGHGM